MIAANLKLPYLSRDLRGHKILVPYIFCPLYLNFDGLRCNQFSNLGNFFNENVDKSSGYFQFPSRISFNSL